MAKDISTLAAFMKWKFTDALEVRTSVNQFFSQYLLVRLSSGRHAKQMDRICEEEIERYRYTG